MNRCSGSRSLMWAAAATLALAGPAWADDKKETGKPQVVEEKRVIILQKGPEKGADETKVIVIQLDASKVPPDFLKKLLEMSKAPAVKPGEDKKPEPKKVETKKEEPKKGEVQKPAIVQVDLNKLPPDLAKRLKEELGKAKGDGKKGDDKEGERKRGKPDDDDKKKGKKDDDDKKKEKKDD